MITKEEQAIKDNSVKDKMKEMELSKVVVGLQGNVSINTALLSKLENQADTKIHLV